MKKYYSYVIVGISFVLIISTSAFYYSYTQNIVLDNSDDKSQNADIENSTENKELVVSSNQENRINSKTEFELNIEDRKLNKTEIISEKMPVELIGLNKEQVVEYYNKYMENPGIEETNKGLLTCDVVSFSDKKLVVKKIYDDIISKNKFFVIEENGFVTVYYQDKKSVFEYTQISVSYLHEDEIRHLKEGFYVENENKLYSILEGYSS